MKYLLWRNKIKRAWFEDGDRKKIYNTVKLRYASNKITSLSHKNRFLEEGIELDNYVIKFYRKNYSIQKIIATIVIW